MITNSLARRLRCVLVVLLALAAPSALAEGPWRLDSETWYEVELAGSRAGWLQDSVWSDGERYRKSTRSQLSIARGPVPITIEILSTTVETADGEPILMRHVQDMGMQQKATEWIFQPDHVLERTNQGGRVIEHERPLPDADWLTPMEVRRRFVAARRDGDEHIEFKSLDPQNGLRPITTTMTMTGEGSYPVGGEEVPVTTWNVSTDLFAIEGVEKYTADGTIVYQSVDLPVGPMVTRLSTKARALSSAGEKAPELLMATFVEPDRPIRDPLQATKAKLRLRVRKGDMPALPSAGAQHVEIDEGDEAIVTVDLARNGRAGDVDRDLYLERSANADTEDPQILALVERARDRAGDAPIERAAAMRALVYETVKSKNLDTAFATASETARTQSGDCSEHAVLLCAMLRADGIPARVAIGLIYADRFMGRSDIFGWHMWTQALIDGRWVDLDATLPRRYHAAHVLTGTSALADGGLAAELASTVMLLGNLEIEVLDVGYE